MAVPRACGGAAPPRNAAGNMLKCLADAMDTSFTTLGTAAVKRHRLRFNSQEGFAEACRRCARLGFLSFRSESGVFVGRLVRVNRQELLMELDAAPDLDSQPVEAPAGKRRRARNALAEACVPLEDVPARLRQIWSKKQRR